MNKQRLEQYIPLLRDIRRGVEREALRTDLSGQMAMTPHSQSFGSALTHPNITMDYAEPLLELVTQPHVTVEAVFQQLEHLHAYIMQTNPNPEILWAHSMPMRLPDEADIPIASFGSSNVGMLKRIYREGLAIRYGKYMQCIAGVHYNFSLPTEFWSLMDVSDIDEQTKKNKGYLRLIRAFNAYHWILMYLFGSSPACDRDFLKDKSQVLDVFDKETLYSPYATSLRMSDLGYKSKAQASLNPCYDTLEQYISTLSQGMTRPWKDYEKAGLKNEQGQWQQLNTHILQIENEYYASIRPKQTPRRGERPIQALKHRGIEYIEVRCVDVDYMHPLGISSYTAAFLDTFLLFCATQQIHSTPCQCTKANENFEAVVKGGRSPDVKVWYGQTKVPLKEAGLDLLNKMRGCAELLDEAYGGELYRTAWNVQLEKLQDVSRTPSAVLLDTLRQEGCSFHEWILVQSKQHADILRQIELPSNVMESLTLKADTSLSKQAAIEQSDQMSLDDFIHYYTQQ